MEPLSEIEQNILTILYCYQKEGITLEAMQKIINDPQLLEKHKRLCALKVKKYKEK